MTAKTIAQRSSNLLGKIIHFPLTRMVLAALCVSLVVAGVQSLVVLLGKGLALKNSAPTAFLYYAIYVAVSVLAAGLAYEIYVRLLEKRPVTELAGAGAWREALTGVLLGMGLMATTVGILWLLGDYRVAGVNGVSVIVAALANDVAGAFFEEILFRAIVFRLVEEIIGSWWALLLSALLFGGLHLVDPHATAVGALAVGLEASILLCAAYLLTRRLWLVVGIHAGWDFMQGGIFGAGVNVAGEGTQGLLQGQLTGPTWLSGGALGVEASVIAVVLVLAVGVYLLLRASRQGRMMKAEWNKTNRLPWMRSGGPV
jgi:membrane protease YdiL (CAAX protease family)